MKTKYDKDADALYLYLKEGKSTSQEEIDEHTIIDLDSKGEVLGIEMLFIKERKPDLLNQLLH